jgi:parallel beta-helix repeat protein
VGNQITNNIVDGNGGYTTQTTTLTDNQTKAIYLDAVISNVLISGNICRGCGEYAIQYHGGDHNTVKNNIFDLSAGGSELAFYQTYTGSTGMAGNTFTNNIVYSSGNFHTPLWHVGIGGSDARPTDNTNLYYSATNASIPNSGVVDTNPKYANPIFVNASAGDYSMPATSPAYTLIQFQPLPTDQGPLPY